MTLNLLSQLSKQIKKRQNGPLASVDESAWNHPFLTQANLKRFGEFSAQARRFALDYDSAQNRPMKFAFVNNIAQGMYNLARMAQAAGHNVTLFPNVMDKSALSRPEWEDFDGEFYDVLDGDRFLNDFKHPEPDVPCEHIPFEGREFYLAHEEFQKGNRRPLLNMLAQTPGLRYEALIKYSGFYPYYEWARTLSSFDAIYAKSTPFGAYASGKPYLAIAAGGELIYDCGRTDAYGQATTLAYNSARFLHVGNPHTLGHFRRLGYTRGIYIPYPFSANRHLPGEGNARKEWEQKYGPGTFVLMTSRIDSLVKGQSSGYIQMIMDLAKERPDLKFIFLKWGNDAVQTADKVKELGLADRLIFLDPAGKMRLLDYLRSCDFVLDQMVLGYYGMTVLEAAAVQKPVIMSLRTDHYLHLQQEDTAPIIDVSGVEGIRQAVLKLADDPKLRISKGIQMREWLLRHHGEETSGKILIALMRLIADGISMPKDLINPLSDPVTQEEKEYHTLCQIQRS